MNFHSSIPEQARSAYATVADRDTGSELEIDVRRFIWCLHFVACNQWADNVRTPNNEFRYIVLEGLVDQASKLKLQTMFCPESLRRTNYEPDLIKVGINKDGSIWRTIHPEHSWAEPPQIVEVAVSFPRGVKTAYGRKWEKLRDLGFVGSEIEIIVVDHEGTLHPKTLELATEEQVIRLKDGVAKMTVQLSIEQRNVLYTIMTGAIGNLPHTIRPPFARFKLETSTTTYAEVHGFENAVLKVSRPFVNKKGVSLLTRRDGSKLSEEGETLKWPNLVPVGLEGITFKQKPGSELGTAATMKILKMVGLPDNVSKRGTQAHMYWAIVDQLKKRQGTIRETKELNAEAEFMFGVNRKAKKADNASNTVYLHEKKPSLAKLQPWIFNLIGQMSEPGNEQVAHPVHDECFNEVDAKFIEVSHHVREAMGNPQCNLIVRILQNLAIKIGSYTFNQRDGMVAIPMMYQDKVWGFAIKGPSHTRRDSDRIPLLFYQLVDFASVRPFLEAAVLNQKKNDSLPVIGHPNLRFVCMQTAWWPAKLRAYMSCTKVFVQGFGESVENMRDERLDASGETLWKEIAQLKDVNKNIMCLQAENVAALLCSDIQLEGFMANYRRVYHMGCALLEGRQVLMAEGANPEGKASEAVIGNPYVFYLAHLHNEQLVSRVPA
jgi:hypothetical protein